jgi:hypothetical protein
MVLILANSISECFSPDSPTVLAMRLMELCFPKIRIMVELIEESYIRFLGLHPKGRLKKLNYMTWPKYVQGRCFFSSNLESLIC